MRVYNVTKQGVEQDADGRFIRRHVPELRAVPTRYIHEPHTMPREVQQHVGVCIGAAAADTVNGILCHPGPHENCDAVCGRA